VGAGVVNVLDWVLIVLVGLYALSGYWQGFITGAFATAGLLLGGALGIWLAPTVLGDAKPSVWVSVGALFIVILCASLGQALLQFVGAKIRGRVTWQPARVLDALGGAVLSAGAVLIVAWALGVAVAGSQLDGVSKLVRNSEVLSEVNSVMPNVANSVLDNFNDLVGSSFFPSYLEPFAPEHIVNVGPGPKRLLTNPDVVTAGRSVLKIHGSNSCGRGIEGSGFVVSRDYVATNAHVVAGVSAPQVQVGSSEVNATVVFYDPETDIAVLHVDTGEIPSLSLTTDGSANQGVAILGYPQDGPFDVEAARIRSAERLRSADIYGNGTAIRDVYSLRGLIRPGNSGGPVVDSSGRVVGVVFAASVTDSSTGYALTTGQVDGEISQGEKLTAGVSTQGCAD
jgi:S1-C subfamily serine protease